MNIAVISRGENLYSTQSLLKAGLVRDHEMEVLEPSNCTLAVENDKPILYYCDEIVDDLHAVIPRIGASNTFFGSSLVRHFQAMGVFCVAEAEPILRSRNKWTSFQILSQANIPVPKTFLGDGFNTEHMLAQIGKPSVIIKILEGTHGQGVILAETYKSALSTIETLITSGVKFVVQEFISESNGTDLRAIVVDGKVVASMKRTSKNGDFRSNLHRGGSSMAVPLTKQEEILAVKAAQTLGLGVCGVDILQSSRGPLVLEINSTPGLEGIEITTGVNISEKIIKYIERNNANSLR